MRLGTLPQSDGETRALSGSLLEANPVYRYGSVQRRYRGIGRVLVARLVVESQLQGAQGRLFIRPVEESRPFYTRLGFLTVPRQPYMRLRVQEAEILLRHCRSASSESE